MPENCPLERLGAAKNPAVSLLAEKVAPASFRPAAGVKLLGAPIGDDAFVKSLLCECMARVEDLLSTSK